MTKLIWVAVLAVGCGAPFEADLFGVSPDVDGGALDGEITPQGDAMGDALPEVDGGSGGASGAGGVTETAGGRSSTGGKASAGGRPSSGGSDAGTGGSGQASGGSVHTSGGAQSAGGTLSAGGSSSGGASSGGAPASGGAPPCNVLHDNGLGQTWTDCAPQWTYNLEQAMKACEASGAPGCRPHDERAACGRVAVCSDDVDGERRCWLYDTNAGQIWPNVCVMPGSGVPIWN